MPQDARVTSAIAHWAPRFVANGVSLTDFEETGDEYNRRIMLLYGIDVTTLPDLRIATILGAIAGRGT